MNTQKLNRVVLVATAVAIFCTGPAHGTTTCQLGLQVVVFQATVSTGNLTTLSNDIVNATVIPVAESGVCTDAVPIAEGISMGDITAEQVDAYRSQLEAFLKPGDKIYRFTWQRQNGETFTTLGVFDANQNPKFEPILAGQQGLRIELEEVSASTSTSSTAHVVTPDSPTDADVTTTAYTLTGTVNQDTKLGTTGYRAVKKITVFTENKKCIADESETISFNSGLFWDVAATKTPTKIRLGGVECKKVVSTITYVTGFKSLKVKGGGGGYSGSIEVEGRLGSNGQFSETDIMCADGSAFHDGVPVK